MVSQTKILYAGLTVTILVGIMGLVAWKQSRATVQNAPKDTESVPEEPTSEDDAEDESSD